jgi:undecaprenyl-diphosphatase
MPLRVFVPYDVVGAGAWAATFSVLGYVFWQSFHKVAQYVQRGLFAFATVVVLGLAIYGLVRLRRDAEFREKAREWLREHEDRPLFRPLVRVSGPIWRWVLSPAAGGIDATARFALGRLRPGRLGLELTTLIALAAVGSFTFFLVGRVIQADPFPRIDRWAFDVVDSIRFDALTQVLKVLTDVGSLPVTGATVLVTALFAVRRRSVIDAVTLVAGMALVFVAVHVAKAAYARPRPSDALIHAVGESYPSAHAAYSVAFVACAVVLVRADVGWTLRFASMTIALVLVVFVALTRVYLHAHYLTDVIGGVTLAVGVWSLVGIAALSAGSVRQNEAPRP